MDQKLIRKPWPIIGDARAVRIVQEFAADGELKYSAAGKSGRNPHVLLRFCTAANGTVIYRQV